jgi:polyhydroxyalkanoate synthesis regulator phasin
MAKKKKQDAEAGTLGRLSKRGEEAFTKLMEELGKNERVTEALGRAMSAKGKVDDASRRALSQAGVAASEELKDMRKHIERLEKRLAKLEGAAKPKPGAKTTASKATTRSRAKKTPADTPSPAPGRAVGGGTGRGSGSGSGSGGAAA